MNDTVNDNDNGVMMPSPAISFDFVPRAGLTLVSTIALSWLIEEETRW
jgi:hypothetical protein